MDSNTLYLAAKTLHIGAFVLAVGIVACTFVTYRHFWVLYSEDAGRGIAAFRAFNRLQAAGMVSLAVVMIAGIAMLLLMDWGLLTHHWFQLKLGLVALIFLNGMTLGRASTLRLRQFLAAGGAETPEAANQLRQKLRLFQMLQLTIYGVIIIVSVFRVD